MTDVATLALAVAVLYLPGLLLARICSASRGWTTAVALAPAVSAGLASLTALGTGIAGIRFGLLPFAATTAVVGALLYLLTGRPALRPLAGPRPRPTVTGAAGLLLLALAVASTAWSWLRGLGGLATPSQEHDTVQHTLITAFIARTGRAAPWQVAPRDYYDPSVTEFYPAGLHGLSALTADAGAGPVAALNATYVVVVCLVAQVGVYALASRLTSARFRAPAGGLAALVAATAYRPLYELSHDAGILSFAASISLVPAVLAVAPPFGRVRPRDVGLLALAIAGVLAVHTSAIAVLVVSMGLAVAVDLAVRRPAWRTAVRDVGPVVAAGAVALVLSAPILAASLASASFVLEFPETSPDWPLGDGLGRLLLFAHGGFTDTTYSIYSLALAAVFYVGLIGCLGRRRAWPLLAVVAFWGFFFVAYGGNAPVPGVTELSRIFYGSLNRIAGLPWLFAPAVAGAGVVLLMERALHRRPAAVRRRGRVLVAAGALVAAALYWVAGVRDYMPRNDWLIASSYSRPELRDPHELLRLTPGDLEALRFLADRREAVGRIMNNANDGSTYGYVYYDLPLVNYATLGSSRAMWGVELLERFRELGSDPRVNCLVERYDVTHVFVSRTVPVIGAGGDPGDWIEDPLFRTAPGLEGLDGNPALRIVFANADATVYEIDRGLVRRQLGQAGADC
ncbi:MAG TPA: DUF6541 family protein [Geodermatophilus sp.]|nr:DUF6541 family protein [Geodermatophilus sp.]